MARFVECSVPFVSYEVIHLGQSVFINHPVNIDLCAVLRKSKVTLCASMSHVPTIEFGGCDAKWVYKTTDCRDLDYDRILKFSDYGDRK